MMGSFGGLGMGVGMIMMVLFWVAVIAVPVWLIASLFPRVSGQNTAAGSVPFRTEAESPVEVLKRRYAGGEISKIEFEEMRRELQAADR